MGHTSQAVLPSATTCRDERPGAVWGPRRQDIRFRHRHSIKTGILIHLMFLSQCLDLCLLLSPRQLALLRWVLPARRSAPHCNRSVRRAESSPPAGVKWPQWWWLTSEVGQQPLAPGIGTTKERLVALGAPTTFFEIYISIMSRPRQSQGLLYKHRYH